MTHKFSQIGFNIKTIRSVKGIKPQDLADQIGISARALQNIENGKTDVPHSRLEQIAKAFGKTVAELEAWHEKPIINNIHQPQDKFIIVNHGSVQYEAEMPKKVQELDSKVENHAQQIDEIKQDRAQFFTLFSQLQEQMGMIIKKLVQTEHKEI